MKCLARKRRRKWAQKMIGKLSPMDTGIFLAEVMGPLTPEGEWRKAWLDRSRKRIVRAEKGKNPWKESSHE